MGRTKSKVVPISHLPNLLAGSERYTPRGMGDLGRMTPNEDECVAIPDLSTLRVCPWDRRVAWTAADLLVRRYASLRPVQPVGPEAPARARRRAGDGLQPRRRDRAVRVPARIAGASDGYLEPLTASGKLRPTQAYDAESVMDALPFLDPMARYMAETGFGLFSMDSEGGDAQYEFDFDYAPGPADGRPARVLPAHGQAGGQAGRAARHLHAQALHRRLGIRAPLQHEHRGCRHRRQPVP